MPRWLLAKAKQKGTYDFALFFERVRRLRRVFEYGVKAVDELLECDLAVPVRIHFLHEQVRESLLAKLLQSSEHFCRFERSAVVAVELEEDGPCARVRFARRLPCVFGHEND